MLLSYYTFSGKWFTGFINSRISLSGTLSCISGFCIAIVAITILENERKKKETNFEFYKGV